MIARIGAVTMFVAAAFVAAAPASAVVLIDDTPSFVQPDENVLLNDDDVAAVAIQGVTNQTATIVDFTQPNNVENIVSPSQGQSRIDSEDGEFTSLRIQLAGGLAMSELEADVHFIDDNLSFTVKAAPVHSPPVVVRCIRNRVALNTVVAPTEWPSWPAR